MNFAGLRLRREMPPTHVNYLFEPVDVIKQCSVADPVHTYLARSILNGQLVYIERFTRKFFEMKSALRRRLLRQEEEILQKFEHPYMAKLLFNFRDPDYIYQIYQYHE